MNSCLETEIFNNIKVLPYMVGALLYSPADNTKIAGCVINERFEMPYSLALCLEDTISDSAVKRAEKILINTVSQIYSARLEKDFYVPLIFIRVRNPKQIYEIFSSLGEAFGIVAGFIVPKLTVVNSEKYINEILNVNKLCGRKVYFMPIIESQEVINLKTRIDCIYSIKEKIDHVKDLVLNVRVGGNDFCKVFGIRRNMFQTIYDIRPVSNILSDITTCFACDYVVSGPVWEYFNSTPQSFWEEGLKKEIQLDRLNGFIGKTVIHPKQIHAVNESLKADGKDYSDALNILSMSGENGRLVDKGGLGERMNEYKTHYIWAQKVMALSKIYGVRDK